MKQTLRMNAPSLSHSVYLVVSKTIPVCMGSCEWYQSSDFIEIYGYIPHVSVEAKL